MTCPMYLFHLALPKSYPFMLIINQSSRNKMLLWVLQAALAALIEAQEGAAGTPLCRHLVRIPVTTCTCVWRLKLGRGRFCRTESLTLGSGAVSK